MVEQLSRSASAGSGAAVARLRVVLAANTAQFVAVLALSLRLGVGAAP